MMIGINQSRARVTAIASSFLGRFCFGECHQQKLRKVGVL